MKKEISAGTTDEQCTNADLLPSASVEANPILCLQNNKFTNRFTNYILKEQGAE